MLSYRASEYMDKTLEEYIRDAGLSKQLIKEEPSDDVVMAEQIEKEIPTCTIEEIHEPYRWNEISETDLQWRMDRHRMPCLVKHGQQQKHRIDLRSKIHKRKNNGFDRDLRNRIVGNRSEPTNPMASFLAEFGRQFKRNQGSNGNQLVKNGSSNQINGAMAVIGGILSSITPTPTMNPIEEKDEKIQNEIKQLQRKKLFMNQNGQITSANNEPEIIEEGTVRSVHSTNISMHHRFSNMTPMEVIL